MNTQELLKELNKLELKIDNLISEGYMIDTPMMYGASIEEKIKILKDIINDIETIHI